MSSREQVVEWLRAHQWRYSRAAKHFGLPKDQVRDWGREARGQTPAAPSTVAPAPARPREDFLDLEPVDRIRQQIREVRQAIDDTKREGRTLDKLHAILRGLVKDLAAEEDRVRREQGERGDPKTVAEQEARIRQDVLDADERIIEVIEDAIAHRRSPPIKLER